MVIVGITGPTGAGKTTALDAICELGGIVIDCDAVYHRLLMEDIQLQQDLERRFGGLRDGDGIFNRKRLGSIVFGDPQALLDLNAITHGYVDQEVGRILRKAQRDNIKLAAIDAIALFESGVDRRCAVTVGILAPTQTRIARIMKREGISRQYAEARVRAQQPDTFFQEKCSYLLHNDTNSPEEFRDRARTLFASILTGEKQ